MNTIHKFLAAAIVLTALASAGVASAQTYYGANYGTSGSCITLSRDLSVGSQGSDVRSLQSFLVSQNYQGGGSWMVTGYFGAATQAALRIYQQQHGLAQTGMADAATRGTIAGCGMSYPNQYSVSNPNSYPYLYNNSNPYQYPYNQYPYNQYPNYNYNYPNQYGSVTISSLSVNSAAPGAAVTISGSGFDYSYNTVYVGGTALSGITSYNGTSLTFTVPTYLSGSVQVYVTNTRGTSNALSLTIVGGNSSCLYPYAYNTSNYYNNYNNCYGNYGTTPTISSVSPQNGAVGSSITIFGSGFSVSNNTVRFGQGIISGLSSPDGMSISFVVPTQLTGYGSSPVGLGTYNIAVMNAAGYTSGNVPFTVTSLGYNNAPVITSVNGPTSLGVNVTGTWTLALSAYGSQYVTVGASWGDTGNGYVNQAAPQTIYGSGTQTVTFTHAYINSGTYTATFTVSNQSGQSNTYTATVTVGGTGQGTVYISSVSPTYAANGSWITIYGSGFNSSNTVTLYGNGRTISIGSPVSSNGSTITVPVNSCPSYSQYCPGAYIQPGTYSLGVSNQNGTSNMLSFTVSQ